MLLFKLRKWNEVTNFDAALITFIYLAPEKGSVRYALENILLLMNEISSRVTSRITNLNKALSIS